jgi:ferredoxin
MEVFFTGRLKPVLEALAADMDVFVPRKVDEHYTYKKFGSDSDAEFNPTRTCVPIKEFLFPPLEMAASYPKPAEPAEVKPFAVVGLKECDMMALAALDKVFGEEEFLDPGYMARREKMFIISGDCSEVCDTCFCNFFDGKGFPGGGFDLNLSELGEGYLVEIGSEKGHKFVTDNKELFVDVPSEALVDRDKNREQTREKLAENTAEFKPSSNIRDATEAGLESDVFDEEAAACVECQACTRVCPTCHCFFLYDKAQEDYFERMKMWDSCMRRDYATVAGGENPRKILGDRLRHRLMHKLVFFFDRYGIPMCVGCGRCFDTCAGAIDIRAIIKRLDDEYSGKSSKEAKVAK